MENPYAPPETPSPPRVRLRRRRKVPPHVKKGRGWAVAGVALLLLAPALTGLVWVGAILLMGPPHPDPHPEDLAYWEELDRFVMWTTRRMLGLGYLGGVLVALAVLGLKNREPWVFWWTTILGGLWCFLWIPYGFAMGLLLIMIMAWTRRELLAPFPKA